MRVFHHLQEVNAASSGCAVAIGNFDGIHLGHQALLSEMVAGAKSRNLTPTVLTFFPHPVEVINPTKKLERLTTTSEKLALLEGLGVEQVLVEPFTKELAALTPEAFFERFLREGLKARGVYVGFNFYFGKGRAGDTEKLRSLCEQEGMWLHVQPPVTLAGSRVSSSAIRDALREGDITTARKYLGRYYSVTGQVAAGDERGQKLGYPTANLHCPKEKLLPKNGVYVTTVQWQKQLFASVTNVGTRPTFHPEAHRSLVEVHILDFHTRIYDEFLQLEFLERIRDEKRFDSIDALKEQIARDVAYARTAAAKR